MFNIILPFVRFHGAIATGGNLLGDNLKREVLSYFTCKGHEADLYTCGYLNWKVYVGPKSGVKCAGKA